MPGFIRPVLTSESGRHSQKLPASDFRSVELIVGFLNRRTLLSHDQMYALAPHCPDCGMVPLYIGHSCAHAGSIDPCPRCLGRVTSTEHRDECNMCPLCPQCCQELRDIEVEFDILDSEGSLIVRPRPTWCQFSYGYQRFLLTSSNTASLLNS
jgi:hypothetical protein